MARHDRHIDHLHSLYHHGHLQLVVGFEVLDEVGEGEVLITSHLPPVP